MTACGRIQFEAQPPAGDAIVDDANMSRDGALPSGLYALWKFDEGSGASAADWTGNAPDLVFVGATRTTGIAGGAVHGDGTTQYVVSTSPLDLTGTNAVTVSVWLRYTPGGPGPYNNVFEITNDFNMSTVGLGMFIDDTSDCTTAGIGVGLRGDAGGSAGCYIAPQNTGWQHVVVVYDKTRPGCCETQLYLDGVAQTPTPKDSNDNTNDFGSAPLFLFSRGGVMAFAAADVDELAIYKRALTPEEIAAL